MRKKIMFYTLLALGIIILVTVTITLSNPLRESQEQIKENILEVTPIGMSMEEVIKAIENNKKWEIDYVNDKNGYSMLGGRPSEPSPNETGTVVGKKSIRVCVGEYRNIFITSVVVFWGFDEDSNLIDVSVRKDKDSL